MTSKWKNEKNWMNRGTRHISIDHFNDQVNWFISLMKIEITVSDINQEMSRARALYVGYSMAVIIFTFDFHSFAGDEWRSILVFFFFFFSVFKMNGAHAMDQIWFALQIQWKHFLIRMNIPTKLSKQCKSYIMCIHCNIAFVKYIYFLMYSFMFKSTILFLIHICIKRLFFWQKEKERFQFLEDFFLFFF